MTLTIKEQGARRLAQRLAIHATGWGTHLADPPCPERLRLHYIRPENDLAFRMAMEIAGRCGRPAGHAEPHASSGCGCPEWNFDLQKCFCDHASCGCY
jgi:hypothetical protein